LKMPREGTCVIQDRIRGEVRVEWASEQDHVVQRADGSCLYHLASVVDDYDYQITHVVRAAEHLPNTARQIFIAQSLGYPLPEYAHLPYVAEPGGTAKLSKRKLDKYKKNKDFASLLSHGESIAARADLPINQDTFNPVIVDFYREIGFLPDAILNYLLLVGWSLDGSTERFTRQQMIDLFSLERVNRAPASFDPQKMFSVQTDYMVELEQKKKVAMVLPYLQRAGLVSEPAPCDVADKLGMIVNAAGDRIKIAGDILDFSYCFVSAEQLEYDSKAFQKRITAPGEAKELLADFAIRLGAAESFNAPELETLLHEFCESKNIGIGQIIHALRVATTGTAVGFGMFETMAVLGKDECVKRLQRAVTAT
jgi:glutamyl-tRNA synthetase